MNFFQKIIAAVGTFLSGAVQKAPVIAQNIEHEVEAATNVAVNVTNAIKDFANSPDGKTIEGILGLVVPAQWINGFINAFKLQLPIWLVELKWIEAESNKTLDEQWADAKAYLLTIKDADVYASQYNTLKGLFIKFFGGNTGVAVNIQQALTLAQPTHNATLVIGQ